MIPQGFRMYCHKCSSAGDAHVARMGTQERETSWLATTLKKKKKKIDFREVSCRWEALACDYVQWWAWVLVLLNLNIYTGVSSWLNKNRRTLSRKASLSKVPTRNQIFHTMVPSLSNWLHGVKSFLRNWHLLSWSKYNLPFMGRKGDGLVQQPE